MADTSVDAARQEILDTLARIEPEHEGLKDFSRLNLQPETHAIISTAIADYDRRVDLLRKALAAIDALLTDNYPALDTREVGTVVYNDLAANADTIEAALGKFTPRVAATSLAMTGGEAEPKSQP